MAGIRRTVHRYGFDFIRAAIDGFNVGMPPKDSTMQVRSRRIRIIIKLFLLIGAFAFLCGSFFEEALEFFGVASAEEAHRYRRYSFVSFTGVVLLLVVLEVSERLGNAYWFLRILGACMAFMIVGPSLMVLNKHIMEDRDFKYPMALSCMGLVSSSATAHLAVWSGLVRVRQESKEVVSGRNWFKTVLPMAVAKAVTLATGNSVYLHLGLGFIQMLKAFCPCVVLTMMYISGVEMPTRASIWCALVIVAGTFVEVRGELNATAYGLFLMASTEVAESTFLVLSAKLLQNHKFSVIEGMYFLAGPSAALLCLCSALFEWQSMVAADRHLIFVQQPWEMFAAAVLGVGVNFLSFFVVQLTSPATLKILNTVRCIGLVIFGVLFYGETCTPLQIAGYVVSLIGFVGYNYFQLRRSAAATVEALGDRCAGCCLKSVGLDGVVLFHEAPTRVAAVSSCPVGKDTSSLQGSETDDEETALNRSREQERNGQCGARL